MAWPGSRLESDDCPPGSRGARPRKGKNDLQSRLVLVEAQKTKNAPAIWRIALARMTNCELRLRDQDREIWNAQFLRFADRLGENLETWMFFWANESR